MFSLNCFIILPRWLFRLSTMVYKNQREVEYMRKQVRSQLKWLACLIIPTVAILLISGCALFNQPPVISSLTADVEQVSTSSGCLVRCVASDQDGDELSYTWSASGGNFSGEGAVVTWVAPEEVGAYTITVEVTDGKGGEATAQLTIDAIINYPPVIESLTAEPSPVRQGKTSTIECVASDPDENELSYLWSTTRGNISGEGATVTWTTPNACGTYIITVTVDDGRGGEVSEELEVEVIKPG